MLGITDIKEAPEVATSVGAKTNNSSKSYTGTENKSTVFCDGKYCRISGEADDVLGNVYTILRTAEKGFERAYGKTEAQIMVDAVIAIYIKDRDGN